MDCNEGPEKDINDVFDSIAFSEEKISNEAFKEGLIKGEEDGKFEGFHLGFHKGLALGAEIGFYGGIIKVLLNNENFSDVTDQKNQKIQLLLEKLSKLLENFPQSSDLLSQIDDIRTNFKKLNSLLKLNLSPVSVPTLSF